MVKGLVIPADDTEPMEVRDFVTAADYANVVGGGIEPVDVEAMGATIFVNDEGIVRPLPFNSRATFLWWLHVPQTRNRAMLAGDAGLVGMPDLEGASTDLPGGLLRMLTSGEEFTVLIQFGGKDTRHRPDTLEGQTTFVLPLIHEPSNWYASSARFDDYFVAAIWAMVLLERLPDVEDIQVVPISHLPAHLQQERPGD